MSNGEYIAEVLLGSCMPIEEVLPELNIEFEDLTTDDFKNIDNITLECSSCNWWVEAGETTNVDGEEVCLTCAGEE